MERNISINEITIKTLDYIERTRGLGLADKVLKKTLEYIEKKRRLENGIYSERMR